MSSSIIESINKFGIILYNDEPYLDPLGTEYEIKMYNGIRYKCKLHKETPTRLIYKRSRGFININSFNDKMTGMTFDYIRNAFQNEELTNYVINEYTTEFAAQMRHCNCSNESILYDLVCIYLFKKYQDELKKMQEDSKVSIKKTKRTLESPVKLKKKNISKLMKRRVWAKHIGEDIGKTKCLCCNMSDITQLTFNCGHIIAESNGGETNIENLLPICQSCNSSMGTQNLFDYKKAHGL
jgi:hypothetical protein